jgi:hypothetical protein
LLRFSASLPFKGIQMKPESSSSVINFWRSWQV